MRIYYLAGEAHMAWIVPNIIYQYHPPYSQIFFWNYLKNKIEGKNDDFMKLLKLHLPNFILQAFSNFYWGTT